MAATAPGTASGAGGAALSGGPARRIDLNADLGETPGDLALIGVVTSASIACGAHAGDEPTMRAACEAAGAAGVAIGAHPGYPDRENMGRTELGLPVREIVALVVEQVEHLSACAAGGAGAGGAGAGGAGAGGAGAARVRYVKLHGALYHRAARDRELADQLAGALASLDPRLVVLHQPGSALLDAAGEQGLAVATEGFCDRAYGPDGTLVDRKLPGAVLEDSELAAAQAESIAAGRRVRSTDGSWIAVAVDSLCLHGDTPGALDAARLIRRRLAGAGVTLAPFAP